MEKSREEYIGSGPIEAVSMKDFIKFTETDYVDAAENYHDTPGDRQKMRMIHAIQGMMDEAGELLELYYLEDETRFTDFKQVRIELGDFYYFMNLMSESSGIPIDYSNKDHFELVSDIPVHLSIHSARMGKQIKNHFNYGSEFNLNELEDAFKKCCSTWRALVGAAISSVPEIESIMKRKLKKRYEKGYSKHAALNRDYKSEDQAALNSEDHSGS